MIILILLVENYLRVILMFREEGKILVVVRILLEREALNVHILILNLLIIDFDQ